MIEAEKIEKGVDKAIKKTVTTLAPDVREAFKNAIKKESLEKAREGLISTFKSAELARKSKSLLCPDTGHPLFYIKIGEDANIEGGISTLKRECLKKVRKNTEQGYLRSSMKHPITRKDPGDNIGENMPYITYKFCSGNSIEVTFVAKGGGSELFGGTRYRVLAPADGVIGVKKFVVDCFIQAAETGKVCPPVILGIGIGGTADLCMRLAKEAAVLRTVESNHPEKKIAELEKELEEGVNNLELGNMGIGGRTSAFTVNIEYALSHSGGLPVGINTNCSLARRRTVKIGENKITLRHSPNWFGRDKK